MGDLLTMLKNKAAKKKKNIVLPEGTDPRMLKAAEIITREGFAQTTLIGNPEEIQRIAEAEGVDLPDLQIIDPETSPRRKDYGEKLHELRKAKGLSLVEADKLVLNPLYYAALMVKLEDADGYVGGAANTTADTFRPALQIIKTAPGISIVSSAFIMIVPDCEYGADGVFVYSDCALNPNPTAAELAEIAIATAHTARTLVGIEPRVAMLSFSTKGSAKHELVDKVSQAARIAKEKAPDLLLDGEMQFDAAIIPAIGKKKAPGSKVAGQANVMIFPDLQAGNIAYKVTERLAKARAVGPATQGLAKPVNDLSRGCSVQDIVDTVAITAVQAQG